MAISFSQCFSNPPKTLTFNPSPSKLLFAAPTPKTLKLKPNRSQIKSMFTGIVEEVGRVKKLGHGKDGGFDLQIRAKTILDDVKLGDSISVNGTCLTVTEFDVGSSDFMVGLAPETLRKTSLIELQPGSLVNLERALLPCTRMGGHFVQGHVDGTGEIVSLDEEDDSLWVKVKTSAEVLRYVVPKGFIAVDGTSLTVVDVFHQEGCFNFMIAVLPRFVLFVFFRRRVMMSPIFEPLFSADEDSQIAPLDLSSFLYCPPDKAKKFTKIRALVLDLRSDSSCRSLCEY